MLHKKQVSYMEFENHHALIKYYNELEIEKTMSAAAKLNADVLTLDTLYEFLKKLNTLISHLDNVIIGIAHFAAGKEKIKNLYPEKTLDSSFKKLPEELKLYFGDEASYATFQNIRKNATPLKEKLMKAALTIEKMITVKLANDSPTNLSPNNTIAASHDDDGHPHHLAPSPPGKHKKKRKVHHHQHHTHLISPDDDNPTLPAMVDWKDRELSEDLLRFTAFQFNAQYSFLSGNGPQKQLANILLSKASLEDKHAAVLSFRQKHAQHLPLMEKIIISLSVNREMISNESEVVRRTNETTHTTWFSKHDIENVISIYSNRKRGLFSFFSNSHKRPDSLIAFLKSEASLQDKRAAIEYYIQLKDGTVTFNAATKRVDYKLGFFSSEDRLKNILTSIKNAKNNPVPVTKDEPLRMRGNE